MDRAITPTERNNGLDTLRAVAIILVFMYHYKVFVSHEATFGWGSIVGWTGVDLFFVLSGYLIADQLFAGLHSGRRISLPAFYARRALRTWTVFWLVLAAYFLLPSLMGGKEPPPLWRFLTFTQNFGLHAGTAFSHAWSLCIEEQFYLVLPLVLWLGLRLHSGKWHGWLLMGALLAIGITARITLWNQYGLEEGNAIQGYQLHIYYATVCRFDEFLPGIGVAMLKHFHRPLWARLIERANILLLLGITATALMFYAAFHFYYIKGYGYGFFMTAFGYSLITMSFGLLVIAALGKNSWLQRLRIPGARQLALWSYSIYLTHKPIAYILQQHLPDASPALLLMIIVAVSILVGFLLYRLVERPFMAMRQRYFPDNFHSGATPLAADLSISKS